MRKKLCLFLFLLMIILPLVSFLVYAPTAPAKIKIQRLETGGWADTGISATASSGSTEPLVVSCYVDNTYKTFKGQCLYPGDYRVVIEGTTPLVSCSGTVGTSAYTYSSLSCSQPASLTNDGYSQLCEANLGNDAWNANVANGNNCCEGAQDEGSLTTNKLFICGRFGDEYYWKRTQSSGDPYVYALKYFDVLGTSTGWVACSAKSPSNFILSGGASQNYGDSVAISTSPSSSVSLLCNEDQSSTSLSADQSSVCEKEVTFTGNSCDSLSCPAGLTDIGCTTSSVPESKRAVCTYATPRACAYTGLACAGIPLCSDGSAGTCAKGEVCGLARSYYQRVCTTKGECTTGTTVCPTGTKVGEETCAAGSVVAQRKCKQTEQTECSSQPVCSAGFTKVSSLNCPSTRSIFTECCPSTSTACKPDGSGSSKPNGASIVYDNKYYYCAESGGTTVWATDLDDDPDYETSCNNALGTDAWTGHMCCGDKTDQQESREYYNEDIFAVAEEFDLANIGGCFNGRKVKTNIRIADLNLIKYGDFLKKQTGDILLDNSEVPIWASFGESASSTNLNIGNGILYINGNNGVYQNLSLRPGTKYNLSISAKTAALSSGNLKVDLLSHTANPGQPIASLDFPKISGDYVFKSIVFTTPDITEFSIKIYVSGSGWVYAKNANIHSADASIMNYNGQFYGCKLTSDPDQDTGNPTYVPGYIDTVENKNNLIIDRPFCNITGNFYCSPNTGWSAETVFTETNTAIPFSKRTNISSKYPGVPVLGQPAAECCPENSCWNGTHCISDIDSSPGIQPQGFNQYTGAGYFCVKGNWTNALPMTDVDGQQGYCPVDYCLINSKLGAAGCIPSGNYIADYYCDNGKRTSRTKFVAMELLAYADTASSLSTKDYVLYCGNYSESLNDFEYILQGRNAVSSKVLEYIKGAKESGGVLAGNFGPSNCSDKFGTAACANNFCVLKYTEGGSEKIIFGTSLNKPINQEPFSFQDVLGADCTNSAESSGTGFVKCDRDTVWYDRSLMLVIASNEAIDLKSPSLQSIYSEFFQNPLSSLVDLIVLVIKPHSGLNQEMGYDYNFMKNARNFNKIYFNKQGNRVVRGYQESAGGNIAFAINYTGFNVDLCRTTDIFASNNIKETGFLSCSQIGGIFYLTTKSAGSSAGGLSAWQDLTAKLRVQLSSQQPVQCVGDYPETCGAAGGAEICNNYQKCNGELKDTCSDGIGAAAKCCVGTCMDITCSDGTKVGTCVSERTNNTADNPKFCDYNKKIINDASACPCPADTDSVGDFCLPKTCTDGTAYKSCSVSNAGQYCNERKELVDNFAECGCPISGQEFANGVCSCPEGQKIEEERKMCVQIQAALSCELATECSQTPVLALSSDTNAHAEIIGAEGNYPWKVCCNAGDSELSVDSYDARTHGPVPPGTNIVLLSSSSNAHIAVPSANSGYQYSIFVSSGAGSIECAYSSDCASLGNYACLFSLSSDSNAHAAMCDGNNAYQEKVCCRLAIGEVPP